MDGRTDVRTQLDGEGELSIDDALFGWVLGKHAECLEARGLEALDRQSAEVVRAVACGYGVDCSKALSALGIEAVEGRVASLAYPVSQALWTLIAEHGEEGVALRILGALGGRGPRELIAYHRSALRWALREAERDAVALTLRRTCGGGEWEPAGRGSAMG